MPSAQVGTRAASGQERTFLDDGASCGAASSWTAAASTGCSASLSAEVRFLPLADFGLAASAGSSAGSSASPSFSSAGLTFFARGFAGFFGGNSGFGCSFMRDERRGSARASVEAGAAALRGIAGGGDKL